MSKQDLKLFDKFAGVAATALVALPVMAAFSMISVTTDEDDASERDCGLKVEKSLPCQKKRTRN